MKLAFCLELVRLTLDCKIMISPIQYSLWLHSMCSRWSTEDQVNSERSGEASCVVVELGKLLARHPQSTFIWLAVTEEVLHSLLINMFTCEKTPPSLWEISRYLFYFSAVTGFRVLTHLHKLSHVSPSIDSNAANQSLDMRKSLVKQAWFIWFLNCRAFNKG